MQLVGGMRRAAGLGDAGGELAGRAHLGDRQEQVGVGRQRQPDLAEGGARPQPRASQARR